MTLPTGTLISLSFTKTWISGGGGGAGGVEVEMVDEGGGVEVEMVFTFGGGVEVEIVFTFGAGVEVFFNSDAGVEVFFTFVDEEKVLFTFNGSSTLGGLPRRLLVVENVLLILAYKKEIEWKRILLIM